MGICIPGPSITVVGLTSPVRPTRARASCEQFDKGTWAARLDDIVLLIRLAAVLAFPRGQIIHLPPAGTESARVLSSRSKQDQLRHVAEIESDATAVRPAVLAH